jgi:hypothetical protein
MNKNIINGIILAIDFAYSHHQNNGFYITTG